MKIFLHLHSVVSYAPRNMLELVRVHRKKEGQAPSISLSNGRAYHIGNTLSACSTIVMRVVAAAFVVADDAIAASVVAAFAAFTVADDAVAVVDGTADDALGAALRPLLVPLWTPSAVMPSAGAAPLKPLPPSLTTVDS